MTSEIAEFALEIDTGSSGMVSPSQLGAALAETAKKFKNTDPGFEPDEGVITEVNGNAVGRWRIIVD